MRLPAPLMPFCCQTQEKVEAEDIRWNGSILGKPLNPGIFSYFLEYVSEEGEKVILKGDITLMR